MVDTSVGNLSGQNLINLREDLNSNRITNPDNPLEEATDDNQNTRYPIRRPDNLLPNKPQKIVIRK